MNAHARMMYLPDTMTNWPWPRAINPHFEDVKAEVDASFRDFKALSPESQEAFDKCDFEHLRIGSELMNVYFIVDEFTDSENAAGTKAMVDIVLDALDNPHKARPQGECILGEISRQFWARAIQTASLPSQRHFLDSYTAYLRAVVVEAVDREQSRRRSIDDYLKLRRDTCGAKSAFAVYEMGMELPDEVFYHPVIVELVDCIIELILIDNDMLSYNREQATGDENHNLVSAIMLELSLDRGGAMAWAARYHTDVEKKFIDGRSKVPSWGASTDALVKEYFDGIATWARANCCWSFEAQRYFGTMGPEIQQTRLVPVLPKVNYKDTSVVAQVNVTDLSKIDATVHREQPSGGLECLILWPQVM
ncbi:isoprenoid synthase domain-containing protein [Suillus paluster]|uniref:isoprenoid synthase domain-containing protein n=1 Tax=Suillus paluster TaxID=48578 RepID=UPI001B86F407|nr:isoprenoid synthase domain-containing protein [Suillus paluster]KAG1742745.1 isoprenoid synthase domain-containing protein [Suillus paluster]